MKINVNVEICREDVKLPEYARNGDAGMDIRSAVNVIIKPGETKIIPTGLKFAIPDGYEIQIRQRSGLSFNTPLRLSNGIGTIDCGFRDEVGVIMTNTSTHEDHIYGDKFSTSDKGNRQGIYLIKKGDRIAQIVLSEVPRISWDVVDDVSGIGENRGGGWGISGVK